MTNPTSNYAWQMPTPTDLVTDLPADFEVFGQAVDNSLWNVGYGQAGKNRIINGNMVIDQRNSGAAVSVATTVYTLDRWQAFGQAADGVFSVQQDSSAPAGFTNSMKVTVTTADASIGSTQSYSMTQNIEGYNVADFEFGSAGAKTTTLSFWVNSSLTGTFGGSYRNDGNTRSYPFTYSISAANTWEKKSVTIPGDTSGTWLKTTGQGLRVAFGFGQGTDRAGTAGAWAAANYIGVTGQTQLIGTLNATWYVTGVQVEIGNVDTPFQTASGNSIQGELAMCQRYYWRVNANEAYSPYGAGSAQATTTHHSIIYFPTIMRTKPSSIDFSALNVLNVGVAGYAVTALTQSEGNIKASFVTATVASGLTAGSFYALSANATSNGYLGFSAEL
jgi:predicted secreted protein